MPAEPEAEAADPMTHLLGLLACHAAVAALRLGVFDALAEGPAAPEELAARTGAAREPLCALLDALVESGYLALEDGRYAERPAGAGLRGHWGEVLPLWTALAAGPWERLAEAVGSGVPDGTFYSWLDDRPEVRRRFHRLQEGMAAGLAEAITLPGGARSLLDVGGGSGTFSRVFCARSTELRATVVDLPSVVAEAGFDGPVTGRGADLGRPGAITERGQDVVLLCNVLHGFTSVRARALVAEAAAALRPGGTLLILESDPAPDAPAERAFQRFFDLNLWHTQGGRLHPSSELAGWAVEAGCTVRLTDLPDHPAHLLLTAVRL